MSSSYASIVKCGLFQVFIANAAVLVLCILRQSIQLMIVIVSYEGALHNRGLLNDRFVLFIRVSSDRSVTDCHR